MEKEDISKSQKSFTRKVLMNLFSVLLPFLYVPILIGFVICLKEKTIVFENFYNAVFAATYFPFTVLISVVVSILSVIVVTMIRERKREEDLIREINGNWNLHLQQDREQFNNLFNNKEIVVKIDIQQFNNAHVKVIQQIFQQINSNENVQDIFVVDNSHPVQWWSESMLAYLAVQSRWLKNGNRNLHRYFILEKSEFSTNEAKKIIGLHVLMGFKTYIITKHSYGELLEEYNHSYPTESVPNKEFFVWNGIGERENNNDAFGNPEYSCEVPTIDKIHLSGKKILCYQSLWNLDTPYHKRKDGNTFITIDGDQINISKWNVKFEFILPVHEKSRNNYLKYSQFLKSNSHTRYVSSEVKRTDKSIHIPDTTRNGSQIDIDMINGIIESFINK